MKKSVSTYLALGSLLALTACSGGGGSSSSDGNSANAPVTPIDEAPIAPIDDAPESPVTVSIEMEGSGMIFVENRHVTCDESCNEIDMDGKETVTITAIPDPGFVFSGWSGVCTGDVSDCEVQASQLISSSQIKATFKQENVAF